MWAKIKKILLIVSLTILIWVWADVSIEETLSKTVTLKVSQSISRDLWVSLQGRDSIQISVDMKGPASKIDDLKRNTTPLEFIFTPQLEPADEVQLGEYNFPITQMLQDDPKIRNLGLTIESCKPSIVPIRVEKLVPKQLTVICVDENNSLIPDVVVEPAIIDMLVKDFWSGEKLKAYVKLTETQIESARKTPIMLKPYIELDPSRIRYWTDSVSVQMPSKVGQLLLDAISGPRVGFIMNAQLVGKYEVQIIENVTTVQFRGTKTASEAYKNQPYHMLLEVRDEDVKLDEAGKPAEVVREAVYNFPVEYVEKGEISRVKDTSPAMIKFKLVPLEK